MRSLLLFVLAAVPAFSQPFSFGVKGGVPLTDFVDRLGTGNFRLDTSTNRYIVGPTVEIRLPFGFGIEFDALFRHLHYTSSGNLVDVVVDSRTTSDAWEFPIL